MGLPVHFKLCKPVNTLFAMGIIIPAYAAIVPMFSMFNQIPIKHGFRYYCSYGVCVSDYHLYSYGIFFHDSERIRRSFHGKQL